MPNSAFDPAEGHRLYNRYLDELEAAERAGFDGVCINEHHQTAYGLMPSPSIIAAALARRTTRAKIAIVGHAARLRNNPLVIAEELAMLDNITGGRMICAFVRGIGTEYFNWQVNPTYSHERYRESHDLILRAMTETGPFAFEGKHFHFPYVNIWPKPFQKPHPPIWAPSTGSRETVEWAAHPDRRYTYLQGYGSFAASERFFQMYREAAQRNGWTVTPDKLGWLGPVYVGETDESAMAEAKEHIEIFINKLLVKPVQSLLPPGYTSIDSMRATLDRQRHIQAGGQTAEKLAADGVFLVGSAETVRRKVGKLVEEFGVGHVMGCLQFGTLPADLTMKNIERFANEVIPHFKG